MRPIIRVVGVGSPHGDDQIGWRLAGVLAAEGGPGLETFVIAEPLELLGLLDGCDILVVLDACRAGQPPGTITCLTWPDDRLPMTGWRSTHGYGVASALALAEALGRLPPSVILFAVEAAACAPGAGLGPQIRAALPELQRQLRAILWPTPGADPARSGADLMASRAETSTRPSPGVAG